MTAPNILVSISAPPKSGKTHMAMTFPEPIALFSLDFGAQPVRAKFPNKEIDIFEHPMPLYDSLEKVTSDFQPMWEELRDGIYDAFAWKKKQYQTIVIDTGTALWEVIRYAYNEEEGKALGATGRARNYGEPNARAYGIFQRAKLAGINLVVINHLKDKWVDDKATGEQILDGWRRTEGIVDVVTTMHKDYKTVGDGREAVFHLDIVSNRFDPNIDGFSLENPTYDDLLLALGVE